MRALEQKLQACVLPEQAGRVPRKIEHAEWHNIWSYGEISNLGAWDAVCVKSWAGGQTLLESHALTGDVAKSPLVRKGDLGGGKGDVAETSEKSWISEN